MPKLSIITINLNNKDGLVNTAKSVVTQTWTDYEWIIIDGGSTDGSVDVIKEYAEKTDKLVYWCSEPDGGIYQGMNKGIAKANGEYCWFLNSGDCAYKNTTLEEIFANEFDEDIIKGILVMEKKGQDYNEIWDSAFHISRSQRKLPVSDKETRGPIYWVSETLPHQATFTKTAFMRKLGCFDLEGDVGFFMFAMVKNNATVKYLPLKFAFFEDCGVSNSAGFAKKSKERRIRLYKKYFLLPYWFYKILSSIIIGKLSFWRKTYERTFTPIKEGKYARNAF
ncbi:MAG: glycosyltransferase [Chitinivibrionia bacterium]|nr:glycosyltransferase [Chitinivibrionia bacterium]